MKQITEQEIKDAALNEYVDSIYPFNDKVDSFIQGANWAISKLHPEWIPCNHKDILPEGRYALYVYNPQTKIGHVVYEAIGKYNREISYFFVTHYCPINLPSPPNP